MTLQEQTKQKIEVMQAYLAGKEVEYRLKDGSTFWMDISNPIWAWDTFDYRVKPEAKPSHNFKAWDAVIAKKLCDGRPLAAGDIKIIRSIDTDELCFENSIKGDAKDYISIDDVLWYWEYQYNGEDWVHTVIRYFKEDIFLKYPDFKDTLAPLYALGTRLPEDNK